MNDKKERGAYDELSNELLTVREAAELLRMSESTVWRWINQGLLPSYRVGPKRVFVKRAEVASVPRLGHGATRGISDSDRSRLNIVPFSARTRGVDPIEQARALRQKQRARPGWRTRPEAWEDLNEMRDERSRELE